MKKHCLNTSFLFCLLLLGSCIGPKYLTMDSYKKNALQDQKSVVFFDITESYENELGHKRVESLHYVLAKLGDEKTIYEITTTTWLERFSLKPHTRTASERLLILEPGIYYVDYVALTPNANYSRWLPSPGIKDGEFLYGAFEVKPNEVVDMGRLNLQEPDFEYSQNIDQLKQELKSEKKEELVSKVKPGVFYPAGSAIPQTNVEE
jgi:hypothetical protein